MNIKELYIISKTGFNWFHYKASFSDYSIDKKLFAGFMDGTQNFVDFKSIVQNGSWVIAGDRIQLVSVENIIIIAIMPIPGVEQIIIDQLLTFIRKKFVENYQKYLDRPNFQWDTIVEDFTKQIEFIWADKEAYEEEKRGLITELIDKVIRKQISLEILQWKITSLFINSPQNEIVKTIDRVKKLYVMVSRNVTDPILESEIKESFSKSIDDLNKALRRHLILYCEDSIMYDIIYKKALGMNLFSIPVRNASDIEGIVANLIEESLFNILYFASTISEEDFEMIKSLSTRDKCVYLCLKYIPNYTIDYRLNDQDKVIVKQNPEALLNKVLRSWDIIEEILKEIENEDLGHYYVS
ncbi:MAG: hypothetical protein HeimC3_37530 [Candidatus Heimdallarchaeota archaeon LC_3]|nr:MAG: hypothetical protein HeimC3_37530 [Candidatus Heimdallarchaeota archaeon LC_3]